MGILIMGIASLIGNILFIIPMQASTREGGMVIALSFLMIGVSEGLIGDISVAIGLFYRIREFIFIFAGIIMVLIGRRGKKQFSLKKLLKHKRKERKHNKSVD